MGYQYISTKTQGVRYREHESRKHGRQKDKYFTIRYTVNNKRIEEGSGWASEGWSESRAAALLYELRENNRSGIGPKTYKDKCNENKRQEEVIEQQRLATEAESITLNEVYERYGIAN